ncbi:putative MINDY deubiquitinase [Helianthus annuus]|uniref:MINDY deubiquitinase n=1 Tax=Helianthus annuus TaxID=4232 RepID=A0A9K3JII8_HELAN|nr:ubiquitin carboxyl-terminal hydrolase MINDY-1-like [Helianthus annuus]KAF5815789.1 putative MINDY deubiquitinase [Helianthus annuus]
MASLSEQQQTNREDLPTVKELMHKTKIIQFFGRDTPIILQNDNGPCPLLAICNVLLLRNNLSLSSDVAEVSQEKLLSLVAERLIDSNSNVDNKDAGYVENQQQNIADAIDLLPRLATGIDVNIKFTRIDDFEFTRECAIFDLLDIPLYHGWIVDSQDSDTSSAIGSKSYNTLMGELVALETQNMETVHKKISEEDRVEHLEKGDLEEANEHLIIPTETVNPNSANDKVVNGTVEEKLTTKANVDNGSAMKNCDDDLITFESDNESHDGQTNASESEKHERKDGIEKTGVEVLEKTEKSLPGSESSSPVDQSTLNGDVNEVEKINIVETKSNESCSSSANVVLESSKDTTQTIVESNSLVSTANVIDGEVATSAQVDNNVTSVDDTRPVNGPTAIQGELIRNFLKNSASQLTVYGLFCLQEGLKERELCVFFRNNHFNTMFKFEGELYILATDQGYLNQPDLVWEKLNEVNGDTVFMNSNFKKFKAENHDTRSWDEQNARATTADYLARIDNAAQGNTSFSSDMQLAIALQQQEFEQQQQPQPRVLPQSPTTSRSGLVVGPQHVHPSRPKHASTSSRQEPKQSKDKCTIM